MKVKSGFAVREIGGDYILIPLGEMALKFSGFITTNAVGAYIWECLQKECSKEALLTQILEEFDIDEAQAKQDMEEFLDQIMKLDLLEEKTME